MKPQSGVFRFDVLGPSVYEYTNNGETSVQPEYVEFSAPDVELLHAEIDGHEIVHTWAGGGGNHSWWSAAGGRFMRYPLKPGQKLTIELTGGAVRIDWYE